MDVNSGAIVFNKALLAATPTQFYLFTYIEYDSILNKYYSLFVNLDAGVASEHLVALDPASGITTSVNPSNKFNYADPENVCYNEKGHSIIFIDNNRLYTLDVNSGITLSEPRFNTPTVFAGSNYYAAPYDYFGCYGLEYDDSIKMPLALYNGHLVNTHEITFKAPFAFPNPFSSVTNVFLENTYSQIDVALFNSMGQRCQSISIANSSIFTINKNGLPAGDYFANVQADNKNIGVVKLVIQ